MVNAAGPTISIWKLHVEGGGDTDRDTFIVPAVAGVPEATSVIVFGPVVAKTPLPEKVMPLLGVVVKLYDPMVVTFTLIMTLFAPVIATKGV
jgi:hypothetical protein